jgi:hypothetical protein
MRIPWIETKGHDDLGGSKGPNEVAAPIRLCGGRAARTRPGTSAWKSNAA